jgi:predicted nucleic acid-binding protein
VFYIDTSVLAAYYCPEPLSELAETKLRGSASLLISDLTELELCSAIARKARSGELPRQDAMRIFSEFQSHADTGRFRRHSLSTQNQQTAKEWLKQMEWPLRTLDALHLAVASALEATILTADAHMAQCAKSLGLSFQLLAR